MQHLALLDVLNRLGRRLLFLDGAAGAVWGVVAAIACFVGGAWLDLVLELPGSLRVGVLILAAAAAAIIAYRWARVAIVRGSYWQMAQRLDAVLENGGQVLSGVDLAAASELRFHSHNPELSAGLALLAVERATQLARSISSRAAVPPDAIRRALATLGVIAAVTTLFAALLPRV